jgi:trehalose 6-phosphate phosphatase
MQPILSPKYRPVLQRFLMRKTLLAFDYDGTLAPIVDDPENADMRPRTRELLQETAKRYPTTIISGRSRGQIQKFLRGVQVLEIIGNHGAETGETVPEPILQRVMDWRRELEKSLANMEGVMIEDKGYSLSVHYRHARDPDAAFSILGAAEHLPGARQIGGKCVLNIVPNEAPDKGTILLRLCARHQTPLAVFLGDDDTDEDVFALNNYGRILGVRVGISEKTAAPYYIGSQTDIDRFLETVITLSITT